MTIHEVHAIQVEFERYGRPEGHPVVVHHGLVGAAALPAEWQQLAIAVGIDLISIARPGYGQSDPVVLGSIVDWSPLLAGLLDGLGVGEFSVLGVSAGAPYSYAAAATLSGRVRRVAVLSGLGLVNEPQTRTLYTPASQEAFASFADGTEEQTRAFWQTELRDALPQLPEDHPWQHAVTASLAHDAAGPAREAILQQRPWGFDLAAITAPVTLWHSCQDEDVPFPAAEIIAERIPTATLNIQSEAGHAPSTASARAAIEFLAG